MQLTTIRGVNLGGWLVLEKWMMPSLFAGMPTADQATFYEQARPADIARLRRHHEMFVTRADITWLAARGITAVRVPLGYWHFGDRPPYLATDMYLERLFKWTQPLGMQVLLSVHAPAASQNGQDHSGRAGAITWTTAAAARATLAFVRQLTERYGGQANLYGVEVLNEPDLRHIPRTVLLDFYRSAYRKIEQSNDSHTHMVFSDGFRPMRWGGVLPSRRFPQSVLDVHHYQCFNAFDKPLPVSMHGYKLRYWTRPQLWLAQRTHPVIIGEWSLALDGRSLRGRNNEEVEAAYQAYARSQLAVYERTAGWFYWSYKTEDSGPWNFRASVERGRLPNDFRKKPA